MQKCNAHIGCANRAKPDALVAEKIRAMAYALSSYGSEHNQSVDAVIKIPKVSTT
jgi:hypothetical protein